MARDLLLDRPATLFFPAVSPATLTFATVVAVVKPWGRIRGPAGRVRLLIFRGGVE
jgi:hypothetical protein